MSLTAEIEHSLGVEYVEHNNKITLYTDIGEVNIVPGDVKEAEVRDGSPPTVVVPRELFNKIRESIRDDGKRRRLVEVIKKHILEVRKRSVVEEPSWKSLTLRKYVDWYVQIEKLARSANVSSSVRESVRDVLNYADEVALEAEQTHPSLVPPVDACVRKVIEDYYRFVTLHISGRQYPPSLFIGGLARTKAWLSNYRMYINMVKTRLTHQVAAKK